MQVRMCRAAGADCRSGALFFIGSGQGLEGFGTEEDGAVGRFHEMEFALLHATVQGAGGEASEGSGCVNGKHYGPRAALFAVQKDALFMWPQDGGLLSLYKDFDVPRQLQSCTVFLPWAVATVRF
jgi:hypothetical protein